MTKSALPFLCTSLVALSLAACEEQPKPAAETPPTPTAAPTPAPTPAPEPPKPAKAERPTDIETTLTDERRGKIEGAIADAKGFVVLSELEAKLREKKVTEEKAALAAFDKLAKNKWVLFAGPTTNVKDGKFDLGVTYTPRAEGDPMGMSRQFFLVTFSDVEKFDAAKMEGGKVAVVIAKYEGAQQASGGKELVEAGLW